MKITQFYLFFYLVMTSTIFVMHAKNWSNYLTDSYETFKETHFYAERLSYKKGGVTLSFPEGYFSSIPCVYLSIQFNKLPFGQDVLVTPYIVSNQKEKVDIKVNKAKSAFLGRTIQEADTDDIYVYIFAFGA